MPEFISILRWIRDIVYPKAVELENTISNLPDTLTGGYSQNYIDNIVKDLTKNVKTIDDLLLEDGLVHKAVIVEDIERGGTFVYKTVNEINPHTGQLYSVDTGTVFSKLGGGFWARQYSGAVNVKWFGAKGDFNGLTGTDNTLVIQNVINLFRNVFIPAGHFMISSPLIFKYAKQYIIGAGGGVTQISTSGDFSSVIVGGIERKAIFVYQPDGDPVEFAGSVIGGVIKGITLGCYNRSDGIIFNRVNQQCKVEDVHIYEPFIGIDNFLGFCHVYTNVYIQSAKIIGIALRSGSNGTSINGGFIFGTNFTSDRIDIGLLVEHYSGGNAMNGGAIEICDAGIRVIGNGNIALNGVDMEEIHYRFIDAIGLYNGETFIDSGASSIFNGCQFVGVPYAGGINAKAYNITLKGCTFINNEALPTTVYALQGEVTGKKQISNFKASCISEENCTFYGWGNNVRSGTIISSFVGTVQAEDIFIPNTTFTPLLTGFTIVGTPIIQDARCIKMGAMVTINLEIRADFISTTELTSYIEGLPYTPITASSGGAISGTASNGDSVLVYKNGRIFLPTKSWGNSLIITATYFVE